jgi:anti-sigma28 factor (negative regulator of flagellin synthesis)
MVTPGRLPLPVTPADRAARARRVAEIARRVAAGTYRVPAERVAASLLAAVREARR